MDIDALFFYYSVKNWKVYQLAPVSPTGWVTVSKRKLFILSEYVNKIEKIGGRWRNMNSCREHEALSDIFT